MKVCKYLYIITIIHIFVVIKYFPFEYQQIE